MKLKWSVAVVYFEQVYQKNTRLCHPDEPESAFILESYAGFLQKRKEESKRWWLIAMALEHYEEMVAADEDEQKKGGQIL